MKQINCSFDDMLAQVPIEIAEEVNLEFAISDRIYSLMTKKGLSKIEFANALGRCPSEVAKWLSGQYNFNVKTLAMLSTFFGEPIVTVYK